MTFTLPVDLDERHARIIEDILTVVKPEKEDDALRIFRGLLAIVKKLHCEKCGSGRFYVKLM